MEDIARAAASRRSALPTVEHRARELARVSERRLRRAVSRIRARSGSARAGARRAGGALSVQADGVQGRVRSGAPADASRSSSSRLREMWEQVESIGYNLHPPLLRALGWKKKLKLGPVVRRPAADAGEIESRCAERRSICSATPQVRREERALIVWYRKSGRRSACRKLTPGESAARHRDRLAARSDPRLREDQERQRRAGESA